MIRILTGRSGVGKTTKMIDEIITKLNDESYDKNIILFVPEQMSFQSEYDIAKRVKGKGYTKLQVFSFKRLGHRLFLEVGGANKLFINDLALNMMLAKIIENKKNDFLLYKKVSTSYNFVELIKGVIKEFKSFRVKPEHLETVLETESIDETLRKKLHDIHSIYQELIKMYEVTLLDNEDFYEQLGNVIKDSQFIKNSEIYIDGYHSFTNVELFVVNQLLKYSLNTTLLFTMANPKVNHDMANVEHLFNLPYRTLNKILDFAHEEKVGIELHYIENEQSIRYKNEELFFLERNYENELKYEKEVNHIALYECENPTGEVHHVARMIYNDIIKNERSYSDYVIYTNNEDLYYPLIKNIFRLYDIPVFIDDKKLMLDHSILNFIDALLEIIKSNFRYEAMFRAIKTEMFMPLDGVNEKNYAKKVEEYRRRIDILENYCLSHGITGKDWRKDTWELDLYKKLIDKTKTKTDKDEAFEKQINEIKQEITIPLFKFIEEFKSSVTVREQIRAIFNLLVDLDIATRIDLYEKKDIATSVFAADLNNAKKHKQVYNSLIKLFDELIEVCGDYTLSHDELIKVLQTGFKSMKFAIVPPAIDQVMVGTIKRSRFEMMGHFDDPKSKGVKKAFVLGVNENEMPRIHSDSGLITNQEREFLRLNQIEIMPTVEEQYYEEYFLIYTILTSASEQLSLSYTLSSHDKKEAYPSEMIEKLRIKFPNIKIKTIYDFPIDEEERYITSKMMTTAMLLQSINLMRKGYSVHEIWKALYGYYRHHNQLSKKLIGVKHNNVAVTLDEATIHKLYPDNLITGSISSIERYNSCPYSYFLEKGLKIKERDLKGVESADIGDLYHDTLREIASLLIQDNKNLHDIELSQIRPLVSRMVEEYAQTIARKYFLHNKRNQFTLYTIKESLIKSLEVMHYQSRHSQFRILAVEERFGPNESRLKVSPITLDNGKVLQLKGIIDRIDVSNEEHSPYIRIIDYKSGDKDIDFTKVYHRLSLQLFTYLDVVLNNANNLLNKDAKGAGVFYYHIQNSLVKLDHELDLDTIQKKHNEAYQMNGYLLNEKEVASLCDDKISETLKSDIVRVVLTKDGAFHKTQAKVLSQEDMDALRKYSLNGIKSSMEEITKGKIEIKPVKHNNNTTCKYCLYHSICKFDTKLRENQYKEINHEDAKALIERMKQEIGGGEDEK